MNQRFEVINNYKSKNEKERTEAVTRIMEKIINEKAAEVTIKDTKKS